MNGKDSSTGFAGTALHPGDRIDVIATDFTQPEPPLLTIVPTPTAVRSGTTFSVKVTSLDTSGSGTTGPAANAVVSYGSLQAVADANGVASFMGTGTGFGSISATLSRRDAVAGRHRLHVRRRSDDLQPAGARGAGGAVRRRRAVTPISTASTADRRPHRPVDALLGAARVLEGQGGQAPRRRHLAGPLRHRERQLRARPARRHALQLPARERHARTRDVVRAARSGCLRPGAPSGTSPSRSRSRPGRWRAFSRATDGAGNVEAPFESQTSFTVAP